VNIALVVQRTGAREAGCSAPLLDRRREDGQHQDDDKPHHYRGFGRCVPGLHGMHHRSLSAVPP